MASRITSRSHDHAAGPQERPPFPIDLPHSTGSEGHSQDSPRREIADRGSPVRSRGQAIVFHLASGLAAERLIWWTGVHTREGSSDGGGDDNPRSGQPGGTQL